MWSAFAIGQITDLMTNLCYRYCWLHTASSVSLRFRKIKTKKNNTSGILKICKEAWTHLHTKIHPPTHWAAMKTPWEKGVLCGLYPTHTLAPAIVQEFRRSCRIKKKNWLIKQYLPEGLEIFLKHILWQLHSWPFIFHKRKLPWKSVTTNYL